ncbi:DNA polymerase III subunit alpha [Elizabethkingia anophelis]|uniref:DNA-directed DNA polymerase n=1 Tax=Elizabethkingia anophelis TaxID=1117645 RepID=A0A455ZE57_9FLAO|nr:MULTISPECIES: DNA polymerase III subunit alpha [Elizabethkingia]KUF46140.1 DNA polymerase III subunit alpha [Elizabethkingia anophelis]MCT3644205.1 DNA polymerase III subunit alpha [Elizabethkingia anophelis]MCT3650536.1 DNA polymerase III subunit alpha [Elizabethkingia anophelis]MCT3656430.1 DNA polymerase III subunit alpha [Elizabethkingia anophelis]MCT3657976.1 DNA polymerase III subunit alpha [Elizabethkingia anophelis]
MYLNCHTFHSLRYGTLSVEELVNTAKINGVDTLCLTDINTVTAIYEFLKLCKEAGIKPVVGMEVRHDNKLLYILLARNAKGIAEMNQLLTDYNCDEIPLPERNPAFQHVITIYLMDNVPEVLLDNEYIGIRPEQLNLLFRSEWKRLLDRMVILQPVTFNTKKEYNLHRVLRAIDYNTLISKLQPQQYCTPDEVIKPLPVLLKSYEHYPEIVANTQSVIDACSFDFDFSTPKNKKYYTDSKANDLELLTRLTYEGLKKKYDPNDQAAIQRVEKELKVIDELHFSGYFLITWDIVQYSNSLGLMHIGRGSGANSIISYCLGITDICPIELDLYFERFLNLNRKTPPDFDIDWSWQDRDTILEYIFKKYGKNHVAFCGTNVEFKYRSIFREVGKVFGLPKEELDMLATQPVEMHDKNSVVQQVYRYGKMMEKFPNQRSMHACGILISEEPITTYSALEMPPKGFPIVQFDMHVAEDIGLEKFDILSQRGIGHINDTAKLIKKNRGIDVDIRDTRLSKDEKRCNEFLSKGHTIGCFYIESPAMRGLLRRLKCDNYKVLVAASSIIRPGVAQSGMMKEYIFRHNHPDQFEYFHPVFEEQLGETYGIMVYQEDVIKIALHYGGLSAPDGDILRRAMSGKGRSLSALQRVKDHFFESCAQLGHPEALSTEVYRQIESFAGYSFCKAHSASYAVESYQSLYLKVYYPVEFMVAVINNQGGFYRTEVYVHEAKMSGANILPPCVNKSEHETTLYGIDVYIGFMHLQSLETRTAHLIVQERNRNGDYRSLEDFIRRISVGIATMQILIFIGAFRFTGFPKNELLLKARMLLNDFKPEQRFQVLFEEPVKEYELPVLKRDKFEDAFDEIELLGFPITCSPFDLLQTRYRGSVMASELVKYHKKEVKMLVYLISRKHVPTKRGVMYFGTWIDAEGEYFDTAHFPDSLAKYPFQGGGCYLLLGTVEVDYHFPTITVIKMAKMPFIPDPRYAYDEQKRYEAHQRMKEDVSMTHRKPYPQEHEIGLPRKKLIG